VQAQTVTYYHAVIYSNPRNGILDSTIPTDSTFYFTLQLNVVDLMTFEDNENYIQILVNGGMGQTETFTIYSDGLYIDLAGSGETFTHLYEVPITGIELVSAKITSASTITLYINNAQVYTSPITVAWDSELSVYEAKITDLSGESGEFEAWITDSPLAPAATPTPTPTPTPAPTPTPTSWVHNTAVPIGQNIGGLNTIILLLLLAGVGLSMTMLIFSKLKSNIIEAIIIMFIMGTAGLVAIYWLIGGFA
jgi:hypothetical protein